MKKSKVNPVTIERREDFKGIPYNEFKNLITDFSKYNQRVYLRKCLGSPIISNNINAVTLPKGFTFPEGFSISSDTLLTIIEVLEMHNEEDLFKGFEVVEGKVNLVYYEALFNDFSTDFIGI